MKTASTQPDRIFRALADPIRLRILQLLLSGELCVCELVGVLQCPQPTVSRHLAYLRKTGMVTVRRDRVWSYYQLAPEVSEFDTSIRNCLRCCANTSRRHKDLERLNEIRLECCE